jgi:hypothetical protein
MSCNRAARPTVFLNTAVTDFFHRIADRIASESDVKGGTEHETERPSLIARRRRRNQDASVKFQ